MAGYRMSLWGKEEMIRFPSGENAGRRYQKTWIKVKFLMTANSLAAFLMEGEEMG